MKILDEADKDKLKYQKGDTESLTTIETAWNALLAQLKITEKEKQDEQARSLIILFISSISSIPAVCLCLNKEEQEAKNTLIFKYTLIFNELLRYCIDINMRDTQGDGYTFLHHAAIMGSSIHSLFFFKILLNANANCTIQDKYNETPLIKYFKKKEQYLNKEIITLLTESHSIADGENHTPLYHALANGHIQIALDILKTLENNSAYSIQNEANLKDLLIKQINFYYDKNEYNQLGLIIALSKKVSLENEIKTHLLSLIDNKGLTTLKNFIEAECFVNAANLMEFISKHIIPPNLQNFISTIDESINKKDANNCTALHRAIRKQNDHEALALLKLGIDASLPDNNGKTALHYAVEFKRFNLIKDILKCPTIDINARDNNNCTPLHYLKSTPDFKKNYSENEAIKLVQLLCAPYNELEAGINHEPQNNRLKINFEAWDGDFKPPIYYAVINDWPDVINLLVEKGANINNKVRNRQWDSYMLENCDTLETIANKKHCKEAQSALAKLRQESNIENYSETYNLYNKLFYKFGGCTHTLVPEKPVPDLGNAVYAQIELTQSLEKFSETFSSPDNAYKKECLQKIIRDFQTIKPFSFSEESEKHIQALQASQSFLIHSGHKGHYFPAVFTKDTNGEIFLTLIDRGSFHKQISISSNKDKHPCACRIQVPEEKLGATLKLLEKVPAQEKVEASLALFTLIPQCVNGKFTPEKASTAKSFKSNICFYANSKAAISFLMRQHMGNIQALILYKQFSIFERKEALHAFSTGIADLEEKKKSDPKFPAKDMINLCESKIANKQAKLDQFIHRISEVGSQEQSNQDKNHLPKNKSLLNNNYQPTEQRNVTISTTTNLSSSSNKSPGFFSKYKNLIIIGVISLIVIGSLLTGGALLLGLGIIGAGTAVGSFLAAVYTGLATGGTAVAATGTTATALGIGATSLAGGLGASTTYFICDALDCSSQINQPNTQKISETDQKNSQNMPSQVQEKNQTRVLPQDQCDSELPKSCKFNA